MARMTKQQIEAVKQANPIELVAARYLPQLRKRGRYWVSLCPFHRETEPSFYINPEKQVFKCYGCKAWGDVITFIGLIEGKGFQEAVSILGAGLDVGTGRSVPIHSRDLRGQLAPFVLSKQDKELLDLAASIYARRLQRSARAQAYLVSRGVPRSLWDRLRLGYCSGHDLLGELRGKPDQLRRATRLGLLGQRGEAFWERMKGRVVMPEVRRGQVCFLVGRSLDQRKRRYLSLSLRPPLYGLEIASNSATVIVTEGVFDWLTVLAWGYPAVCLLGTQISTEAITFLGRLDRVIIAFDSDQEGQQASQRLAALLGTRAQRLQLPAPHKDINDLALDRSGRKKFADLVGIPPVRE